mmetsp:Transcript_10339/g.15116  ORF Transcript_10339/g.15116 Transcript_10339/m.15116 type:complete len:524 (+) Transcript_10339:528-2099(+)
MVKKRPGTSGSARSRASSRRSTTRPRNHAVIIEKFAKENQDLRDQIQNITQAINMSKSVTLNEKINRMNDFVDTLVRKISIESRKLEDSQQKNELYEAQILDAKIDMGGQETSTKNLSLIKKQVKTLEQRLDKCLKNYSKSISYNKDVRENIESLREERVVFDQIYRKMESELQTKKEEMASVIEASNDAYETRDEAVEEYKKLKKLHARVLSEYNSQFNELDEITKQEEELNLKIKAKEKERAEGLLKSLNKTDSQQAEKRVIRQNWSVAEQKAKYLVIKEKVKQIEETFKKIQQATSMSIDDLIEQFGGQENNNFSMFTYANEQTAETEKLEKEIQALEAQLDAEQAKEASGVEANRRQKLVEVQDEIQEFNSKGSEFEKKQQQTTDVLKSLTSSIQELFQQIGCDTSELNQVGSQKVSEFNMMTYLGLIEQRSNNVVSHVIKRDALNETGVSIIGTGPLHPTGQPNELSIEPPSLGDGFSDEDSDEESEIPFSREELLQRSQKVIFGSTNQRRQARRTAA